MFSISVYYHCMLVGEADIHDVRSAVANLAGRWKDLGISLGIHWSKLDTLNSASDGLREMLPLWLKQSYDVRTIIIITLSTLVLCQAYIGWRNPLAYTNIQNLYRLKSHYCTQLT